MSETLANVALAARRTASGSATLLKGFGRTPDPAPAPANEVTAEPAAAPPPAPSVISAKAEMVGSITTPEELHIEGVVEGDVRASKIVIRASGVVKGSVSADVIVIHGKVEGRIDGGHVLLCAGAMVHGEVTHCSLGIDTKAIFEGSVKKVPPSAEAVAAE